MKTLGALVLATLLCAPATGYAIDHGNLDEGRPLRLEDAYAIAAGEIALETGAGFALLRRGPDRGFFPIEVLYGALPNLQIALGTTLSTHPHDIDEPVKSGDLRLGALYNLNQETLVLPALGVKLDVNLPTGVDARGVVLELKGIVTKSIERLSLHVNAGYQVRTDARREERDGRYELVLGASYPLGAPRYTRATIVADVFTEQSARHGEASTVGAELGFRYQVTRTIVWDAGVGTEFAGPAERSPFMVTTGLSFAF
jgi:outer membrane putative beta-barrel porin/alpha-amylase